MVWLWLLGCWSTAPTPESIEVDKTTRSAFSSSGHPYTVRKVERGARTYTSVRATDAGVEIGEFPSSRALEGAVIEDAPVRLQVLFPSPGSGRSAWTRSLAGVEWMQPQSGVWTAEVTVSTDEVLTFRCQASAREQCEHLGALYTVERRLDL